MKDDMQRSLAIPRAEILAMKGNCLSWDDRNSINIYLAGPDFDYIDKTELDHLVECLQYHNFSVRLPIRENGQATIENTRADKRRLFNADMKMMGECSLLIAVMLFNDQGTLVEIGVAKERGMPVIVYDPRHIVDNLFLEMLPNVITSTPNETIEAVFSIFGRGEEK